MPIVYLTILIIQLDSIISKFVIALGFIFTSAHIFFN